MNPSEPLDSPGASLQDQFLREHAKRDRHISEQQRQAWAEDLLRRLGESPAYRAACTPAARMAEERRLLQQIKNAS